MDWFFEVKFALFFPHGQDTHLNAVNIFRKITWALMIGNFLRALEHDPPA